VLHRRKDEAPVEDSDEAVNSARRPAMPQPVPRPSRTLQLSGRLRLPSVWLKPALGYSALSLLCWSLSRVAGPDSWALLGFMGTASAAFSGYLVFRSFEDGPRRLITDPFIVLIASVTLYFFLGPLLLVFGPESAAEAAQAFYRVDAREALRITAMNTVGLAMLLSTAAIFDGARLEKWMRQPVEAVGRLPVGTVFATFLSVGLASKVYLFSVDSSPNPDVVSGMYRTIAHLLTAAILIGVLFRGRRERLVHALAIAATVVDSSMGALLFNKSAVLIPWLVLFYGLYLRRSGRWVVIAMIAVAMVSLTRLSSPIGDARNILTREGDTSARTRLTILGEVSQEDRLSQSLFGSAWQRLCYLTPQAAAVDLYENGEGGDAIELVGWVLVPRLLFPDKPIITRAGPAFNMKVRGSATASTGIGIFIDGYYNLGWAGLLGISLASGWILSMFAAVGRTIIDGDSVVLLPIVLLGSFIAFRVDGYFVSDYFGTFAIVMYLLVFVLVVQRTGGTRHTVR
jgi:hypothetical protein